MVTAEHLTNFAFLLSEALPLRYDRTFMKPALPRDKREQSTERSFSSFRLVGACSVMKTL